MLFYADEMQENSEKFRTGDKVKAIDGDGTIMTVVNYAIDYLTMSLEAIESALVQFAPQKLVKCQWVLPNGEKKEDEFREDNLQPA